MNDDDKNPGEPQGQNLYACSPTLDPVTDLRVQIDARLNHLLRYAEDKSRRLDNAEEAGGALAGAVQAFLSNPTAVGTNALYEAYGRFMSRHAGNFSS